MRKTLFILLLILFFLIGVAYATTFTYTYDTATPAGDDDPAEADDRMREIKAAVQERMNVCLYWPLTGTEVSDADAGEIRKILFHAPIASTPTVAADHGDLRIKDVDSKAEFTWTDEDENELVLTSKGNNLASDTFLTATDNAGTGSVNLIKADANDVVFLPDNARLATSTAPDVNEEITNMLYVVNRTTMVPAISGAGTGYAGEESITVPNGLILKTGSTTVDLTPVVVTFETAFPNACVTAFTTADGVSTFLEPIAVTAKSTTSITLDRNGGTKSQTVYWLAIGY